MGLVFRDVREFQAMHFESGQPIVKQFINRGERVLLVASQKSGKTIFCLQLGLSVATGLKFADYWDVPEPQRVVYVATEGSQAELQSHINRIETHLEVKVPLNKFRVCYTPTLNINVDTENFKHLLSEVKDFKPALVVLDCLYRVHQGSTSNDETMKVTTERINMFGDDVAVIVPHHKHRPRRDHMGFEIDEGVEAYAGSYIIAAWASSVYTIQFSHLTHTGTIECPSNSERDPKFGTPKKLELIDPPDQLFFTAEDTELTPMAQDIYANLDKYEGVGLRELGRALGGVNHNLVRRAVQELASRGIIRTESQGKGRALVIRRRS